MRSPCAGSSGSASTCAASRRICLRRSRSSRLCLAYLEYARRHPGERRLLLTTAASIAPDYRAAALPDEIVDRMFRLAEAARASGALNARDEDDVFAILHAGWALAHGMAEYDSLYEDPERGLLRNRHRAVFKAYVAGFGSDWTD